MLTYRRNLGRAEKRLRFCRNGSLIISLGFLTSCASVDPKPFSDYATSVKAAQTQMVQAVGVSQDEAKNALVDEYGSNPSTKFSDLRIQGDGDYKWHFASTTPPLYLSIQAASLKLSDLNDVFLRYVNLLATLAGADSSSTDAFDGLASQLNSNATKLTVDLSAGGTATGVPIFSAAASEAFRQYIDKKRKSDLSDALKKNQATVEDYSKRCITLIGILSQIVQTNYNESYRVLTDQWVIAKSASGNSGTNQRKSVAQQVLAQNEHYIAEMAILQAIRDTLAALPKAHADLAQQLTGTHGLLAGMHSLEDTGGHLADLYHQLKSSQENMQ
jgi:Tfp pilus assembly protein PilE